mgnify:CR=1 FL=1
MGLGNPGKEYARTRHNCGFRALDILAEKLGCKVDKGKFQGLYGQCTYRGKKLLLLKPQTYMNNSGRAVTQISAFYKIPKDKIIIIVLAVILAIALLTLLFVFIIYPALTAEKDVVIPDCTGKTVSKCEQLLHEKDFFSCLLKENEDFIITRLMKPAHYVNQEAKVSAIFKMFKDSGSC